MSYDKDTIFAPITAPGKAAVAMVRLSGERARELLEEICPEARRILANPRRLLPATLFEVSGGQNRERSLLDHALAVFLIAPHSYTGEDCVEFNLHGSPFLMARLLDNLAALGARPARPGEFSERAFLNGRMDLSQAEAVADLIAAETAAQARVAREQLEGRLSQAVAALGEPLRNLLAEIEACIDFPEEDIEPRTYAAWQAEVEQVASCIEQYLASYATGKVLRDGAAIVLSGVPNSGKSSVLNWLAGEERAIVTPIPGTTRDSIEERINLRGLFLRLWDTAGLVEDGASGRRPDPVEELGVERSWKRLAAADLVLYLFDPIQEIAPQIEFYRRVSRRAAKVAALLNKADLLGCAAIEDFLLSLAKTLGQNPLAVSALAKTGREELEELLYRSLVGEGAQTDMAPVMISSQRHFGALSQAQEALKRLVGQVLPPELVAAEIREALRALQEIVGITYTEDILGRIFSRFCIGK